MCVFGLWNTTRARDRRLRRLRPLCHKFMHESDDDASQFLRTHTSFPYNLSFSFHDDPFYDANLLENGRDYGCLSTSLLSRTSQYPLPCLLLLRPNPLSSILHLIQIPPQWPSSTTGWFPTCCRRYIQFAIRGWNPIVIVFCRKLDLELHLVLEYLTSPFELLVLIYIPTNLTLLWWWCYRFDHFPKACSTFDRGSPDKSLDEVSTSACKCRHFPIFEYPVPESWLFRYFSMDAHNWDFSHQRFQWLRPPHSSLGKSSYGNRTNNRPYKVALNAWICDFFRSSPLLSLDFRKLMDPTNRFLVRFSNVDFSNCTSTTACIYIVSYCFLDLLESICVYLKPMASILDEPKVPS